MALVEQCSRISEDPVNRTLNIAVAVVLTPLLGVQGVLGSVEVASVERRFVTLHSQSHGLLPYSTTWGCGC